MENGEEEEEDDDDRQSKPKSETRCASMHAKFIRRAMQCFNDEREEEQEEERQKISLPLPIPARPHPPCSAHVSYLHSYITQ